MKKRNILGAILCSVCLVVSSITPVMADAVKVVTLGADLTDSQKQTMLNYFKVDRNQVQILEITNEDEVRHLSAYVPMEQIGTRTVSCAYVKPTTSGGIKVRTANLNWVTCNMIASTLSTSGVTNCEVVAACPFEVSGTGALTGIIMAYQTASGEQLDETKVELATQEMVITGDLAEEVGQDEATNIVNEAKMEILENNVMNADEIYNIVISIAEQNNMMVTNEQLDEIVYLLEQIAMQDYDYEAMKETLENVESNVNGGMIEEVPEEVIEETVDILEAEEAEIVEEVDSILDDLDESILGENVVAGSTEDPTVGEITEEVVDEWVDSEEAGEWVDPEGVVDEWVDSEEVFEEWSDPEEYVDEWSDSEEYVDEWSDTEEYVEEIIETVEGEELYDVSGGSEEALEPYIEKFDLSLLSEDATYMFEQAKLFCAGEYLNDVASLQAAMGSDAMASVTLDTETGTKVHDRVLEIYFDILAYGSGDYVTSDTDLYFSTDLNNLNNELKKLFGIIPDDSMTEDILAAIAAEYRTMLYDDTIAFFEELYGESFGIDEFFEEEYVEEGIEEEYYEGEYVEEYIE